MSWLLTDLTEVALEAPAAQREREIQAGWAHYGESLPVEYQPTAEYQDLFHRTLAESARRVARAVGAVTEAVLAGRRAPVLVSPGQGRHAGRDPDAPLGGLGTCGLDLPHYTISIVRGRGIDRVALRYLAGAPRPGRCRVRRRLDRKGCHHPGAGHRADRDRGRGGHGCSTRPSRCWPTPDAAAGIFGTREDFLIPSACLNSTVSGLVSRTVLNDCLIGPGQFHGAKCYRHLAGVDVSGVFLDAVSDRFAEVAEEVAAGHPYPAIVDPAPDRAGWHSAVGLCERYGLGDINLVKPGVGETTRVLLRRVPWRVLVRPDAADDLAHVLLLARDRNVPVEEVSGLPYSCVGLIRPLHSRPSPIASEVPG